MNLQGYFSELVRKLFTCVEFIFRFENDMPPPDDRINVRLDLENIIIEGSRQLRELEQLQDEIPSLDMALRFTERPLTNVNLSVDEWKVVKFVDPKNTMRQIASANSTAANAASAHKIGHGNNGSNRIVRFIRPTFPAGQARGPDRICNCQSAHASRC